MVSAALFISLILFLILNVPVGIAIGCSSLVAIMASGTLSHTYIVSTLVSDLIPFRLWRFRYLYLSLIHI